MTRLAQIARWPMGLTLLLVLSATSYAQLNEGSLAGTVTDASGAAVAGAAIKITNLQTGSISEAKTDNIGFYRGVHLQPGSYQVRVEAQGFKTTVLENIVVNVNTVARADAKLQVGGIQETVQVTGEVSLVQTEEARLSSIISNQDITNLPVNGRQVYQLVLLQPGVTATNAPVISNVPSPTSSVSFDYGYIANGSTPRGNNFVLDGNSNNNEWLGGTPLIYPSLDAIQELQVQTLNFSAQYGRNNGTVVDIATKSGTNNLHGDVFYAGRNTALNARSYFDKLDKTPLQQNQFGFTVGGPIIKDKTFFFLDYEGSRLKDGNPAEFISETPAFRQAVIEGNPGTNAAIFYQDFPGPPCIDNITEDYCHAVSSQIEHNSADQYLVRIDQHFGSHDQFYGRWVNTLASGDVARQELLGAGTRGFTAPFSGFFADLSLGETHEFSSNTMNDFRFAYSRNNSDITFGIPPDSQTAAILQSTDRSPDFFGQLVFDDGVVPMGGEVFIPRKFVFNTYAISDTFTHIIGRHALKFGFQWRHIQENSDYQLTSKPFYEFGSIFDFALDSPYLVAALVNRYEPCPGANCGQFTDTPRHFRWSQWAGFVQDDWKVTPRLTLNLGLRYELFGSPTETNNILSNIVLGSGSNLFQQIADGSVGRVTNLWNTDKNDFAPRVGVSWDPFGQGTTVLRSGFSIAYNEPYSNLYTNASRLDPPDAITTFVFPGAFVGTDVHYNQFPFDPSPNFAAPTTSNGGISGIAITPSGVYPNLRTNYSMQWFFGVQHQLGRDYGISVNYVGTSGVGGYTREDYNRFDGDVCNQSFCNFFATRLAPGWGQITYISNEAHSTYNGLNAQLKKNFTHGFMFTANYTWGKVLDNVSEGGLGDYFNVNGYAALYTGVQNIQNQQADRGPSEFDATNRFTFTALWSLPSPKDNAVLKAVFGGWQLNTIVSLQSGRPFDVYCGLAWFSGCDFNMDDLAYDRPNRPAGLQMNGFTNQQLVSGLFGDPTNTYYGSSRTSQASQTFCPNGLNSILDFGPINSGPGSQCLPVGSNGNLSRNAFRGPAYETVDLSLFKNFKVGDRVDVQFRAEAFNLLNRVNLYNPIGNIGSPQFGQSTAAFPARQIQLGLKLLF